LNLLGLRLGGATTVRASRWLDGNLLSRRWNAKANTDGNRYSHSDNYGNDHAATYTIAKAAPDSGTARP
jgi:hypothetical protein